MRGFVSCDRIGHYLKSVGEVTVIKPQLYFAAILSTTAIAAGILLGSVGSVESCSRQSSYYQHRYEQASWLQTPLAAVITLPGIAIAVALSLGGRSYQD